MTKDEALRLALEALESVLANHKGAPVLPWIEARDAIKAALEANEFNPDWDTQAVLVEEIQRMAKRIEELEAKDEPYALEASMFSNDRVKVDPVTGNVSIGTPQRIWVELTDDEIEMIYAVTIKIRKKDIMPGEQKMFAKTIQHFLKERNT